MCESAGTRMTSIDTDVKLFYLTLYLTLCGLTGVIHPMGPRA